MLPCSCQCAEQGHWCGWRGGARHLRLAEEGREQAHRPLSDCPAGVALSSTGATSRCTALCSPCCSSACTFTVCTRMSFLVPELKHPAKDESGRSGLVQACMSEHAFERPSASQVLGQLQAALSEQQRSLKLPQLQLGPPTPSPPETPSQEASEKAPLQILRSFPCFQALAGAATGHGAQPAGLVLSSVVRQQQQQPPSQSPAVPLHTSRSVSLTGGDAMRGTSACMSGMRGSRASTHLLTSPRPCSNVAGSCSASRAGLSGVWSSVCASDAQKGGVAEGVGSGGNVGDACRQGGMPHTTSVRFGLASVMRPLSAQSSSVSGWMSEGSTSMSFASHGTAY